MDNETSGPAFPGLHPSRDCQYQEKGMTLRDYFATNAPSDEVQELSFRHLSLIAQEKITGLKCPEEPRGVDAQRIEFQLAKFEFQCAVNAAIRYKLADAMLEARK